MDAVAVSQLDCFAAGVLFARTEGIVPAPEPTHALAEIVRIVNECKATGESKVLLTALCGHGHFDLAACVPPTMYFTTYDDSLCVCCRYDAYLGGKMVDHALSSDSLKAAMATVPVIAPKP